MIKFLHESNCEKYPNALGNLTGNHVKTENTKYHCNKKKNKSKKRSFLAGYFIFSYKENVKNDKDNLSDCPARSQ